MRSNCCFYDELTHIESWKTWKYPDACNHWMTQPVWYNLDFKICFQNPVKWKSTLWNLCCFCTFMAESLSPRCAVCVCCFLHVRGFMNAITLHVKSTIQYKCSVRDTYVKEWSFIVNTVKFGRKGGAVWMNKKYCMRRRFGWWRELLSVLWQCRVNNHLHECDCSILKTAEDNQLKQVRFHCSAWTTNMLHSTVHFVIFLSLCPNVFFFSIQHKSPYLNG